MPVAAAQPITGGSAPAAPPITMFCGVAALQPHRIDDDVEEDREGEQRRRRAIDQQAEHDHRERPPASARRPAPRPARHGPIGIGRARGARHQRVDVGVIPHVERAGGAGADRDAEQRGEAR